MTALPPAGYPASQLAGHFPPATHRGHVPSGSRTRSTVPSS